MDTTLQDTSGAAGDSPPVGQVLDGRYLVEQRIAVGGMATVYRAVDTRLDRRLALKVMHPALAEDGAFVDRFIREAKSAAGLAHPNVVGVYDQGRDGDYVYLAMEYVSGCTLRDVLRERGALQPRAALDILEPVLAALGAAHRAGLVHRDMKPENVLIGDDGRVKVADFGLVRAVNSQTSAGTDTLLGTVSYLAPEQIEHGTADPRADLYACGVMLHEMLTGAKPHDGGTPAQVLYQHVHEDVPAPSAAVPGLAPALDALVARAAAREPGGRPDDAGALLAEVRSVRSGLGDAELDAVPPQARDVAAHGFAAVRPAGTEDPTSVLPRSSATRVGREGPEHTALLSPVPPEEPPASRGGGPSGPRRRHGRLFVGLLAVVLVLLVGTGVWYVQAGQFTHTPAVLDKTQGQAMKALEDAGLDVKVRHDYSERTERGHVIESSPDPGDRVRRTGSVTIVVSRGPHVIAVPDVSGTPLTDARHKLKDAGLEPGTVKRKFDAETAAGSVISTQPDAGEKRRPGSPVALTVSRGAPVDVPDVSGKDEDAARKELEDAGLEVRVARERVHSSEDKGTVVRQSPGEGRTVAKGDTVTLVLSKGPDMVDVPDVGGLGADEARSKLEDAGFEVTVHKIFFGDTVFTQSPDAGEKAPRGSKITLWLR